MEDCLTLEVKDEEVHCPGFGRSVREHVCTERCRFYLKTVTTDEGTFVSCQFNKEVKDGKVPIFIDTEGGNPECPFESDTGFYKCDPACENFLGIMYVNWSDLGKTHYVVCGNQPRTKNKGDKMFSLFMKLILVQTFMKISGQQQ